MEDNFRNNVVEFSMIYLEKNLNQSKESEFDSKEFTTYIFKQLFDIDITINGYGLSYSTKQMTNDIGDLKIYNENDKQKIAYLNDIKKGDLLFFHTQSLDETTPSPNNNFPGHVGIYLGNEEFIHATPSEEKITIDKLEGKWFSILVASRDIIKEIV